MTVDEHRYLEQHGWQVDLPNEIWGSATATKGDLRRVPVHLACLFQGNKDVAVNDALEKVAVVAARKSCMWSAEEDARSQDYREGVEDAASKIARAARAMKSAEEALK